MLKLIQLAGGCNQLVENKRGGSWGETFDENALPELPDDEEPEGEHGFDALDGDEEEEEAGVDD